MTRFKLFKIREERISFPIWDISLFLHRGKHPDICPPQVVFLLCKCEKSCHGTCMTNGRVLENIFVVAVCHFSQFPLKQCIFTFKCQSPLVAVVVMTLGDGIMNDKVHVGRMLPWMVGKTQCWFPSYSQRWFLLMMIMGVRIEKACMCRSRRHGQITYCTCTNIAYLVQEYLCMHVYWY